MTFDELMSGFGVVTAMDMCIWTPKHGYTGAKSCCELNNGALRATDFEHDAAVGYIDTMKITNINQEGPTKTITGGRYAAPLIKYGKTTTLEATDALGSAATLVRFFGANYNGGKSVPAGTYISELCTAGVSQTVYTGLFPNLFDSASDYERASASFSFTGAGTELSHKSDAFDPVTKTVSVTLNAAPTTGDVFYIKMTTATPISRPGSRITFDETFPEPFAIQGYTEFVDRNGEKQKVYIFIPQFYPNGVFNLTQDTEGDAAVFDLSGTLIPTEIEDAEGVRTVIYEIRDLPFFTRCE